MTSSPLSSFLASMPQLAQHEALIIPDTCASHQICQAVPETTQAIRLKKEVPRTQKKSRRPSSRRQSIAKPPAGDEQQGPSNRWSADFYQADKLHLPCPRRCSLTPPSPAAIRKSVATEVRPRH